MIDYVTESVCHQRDSGMLQPESDLSMEKQPIENQSFLFTAWQMFPAVTDSFLGRSFSFFVVFFFLIWSAGSVLLRPENQQI